MVITPSRNTKIAASLIMFIFSIMIVGLLMSEIRLDGFISVSILLISLYYFLCPFVDKIYIDQKIRLKSLSVDVSIDNKNVKEWGIFKSYGGRGYFSYRKLFLIKLQDGSKIVYPLNYTFDITPTELQNIFENFLESRAKDYGLINYPQSIKEFGIKILFLDSFKI